MDRTQIITMLEKALEEARSLGADTRELEEQLQGLRSNWDRMEELMAK